jgi:hypothetical protein
LSVEYYEHKAKIEAECEKSAGVLICKSACASLAKSVSERALSKFTWDESQKKLGKVYEKLFSGEGGYLWLLVLS